MLNHEILVLMFVSCLCEPALIPGSTQDHLQIFNIELKAKMKSYQMPEQVSKPSCVSITSAADLYAASHKGLEKTHEVESHEVSFPLIPSPLI